ncbi:MAG: hypothetical protein L0312_01205, partial [Acidobacteria bacterium]|nr:hypothetical protein [Acidobacteriota bacterium]
AAQQAAVAVTGNRVASMFTVFFRAAAQAAGGAATGANNRLPLEKGGLPGGARLENSTELTLLARRENPVVDWPTAKQSNTETFAAFFRAMLENGVYLAPSQFEAGFLSTAHTDADIESTLMAARKAFAVMAKRSA